MSSDKKVKVEEWTSKEVSLWLDEMEDCSVGKLFEDAEISGEALKMVDRDCLKEMGIKSMGKQLLILRRIKELFAQQQVPKKVVEQAGLEIPKMTRADKSNLSEEQKHLYNQKIKIIRGECQKKWPGNTKVYFKNNSTNSLMLSEMVLSLEPVVKIEEIGFCKSAIRKHILQWASEKNRRIEDGHNFEITTPPAKRARKDHNPKLTGTEDVATDVDKPDEESSTDIEKMSAYSAQLILTIAFNKIAFRTLSYKDMVKGSRTLGVKSRGMGKYDLAQKMALELIKQKYVQIAQGANYVALTRDSITLARDIQVVSSTATATETSASSCPSASEEDYETYDSMKPFRTARTQDMKKLGKIILTCDEETQDTDYDETQDIDSD